MVSAGWMVVVDWVVARIVGGVVSVLWVEGVMRVVVRRRVRVRRRVVVWWLRIGVV
jgi:hypothetical protein